jgi:hypothetical protein
MVLYILAFTFLTTAEKTKDTEPNGSKDSSNLVCY